MEGRTDGRTHGLTDGRTEGRTNRRTGGRTDGRTGGRTDGWTDGSTDGRTSVGVRLNLIKMLTYGAPVLYPDRYECGRSGDERAWPLQPKDAATVMPLGIL